MVLVLYGMMGVGKTTVGRKIAELLGYGWYDTDDLIVNQYGQISEIFEYYGEQYFRRLETDIIKELFNRDGVIISTGGGLVLEKENAEFLKDKGIMVFLRANVETLTDRLKADTGRPLLQGSAENLQTKLSKLLEQRTPIYELVSDFVVDVDGKTVEEIACEIIQITGVEYKNA